MKVLHVLNYGWPYIDGYTTRSIGLTNAQATHLDDVEIAIAVSPFTPLAHGQDPTFVGPHWGPGQQLHATRYRGDAPESIQPWERPAMGLSPVTSSTFKQELASIARRLEIELIHVHHPHYVAAAALEVASQLQLPAVYELRCFNGYYDLGTINPYRTLRGHWQNHLEFQLAREASAAVTISDGLARTLTRQGVNPERLHVVRNSVDLSRFSPDGKHTGGIEDIDGRRVVRVGYATTFETMENLDSAVRAAIMAHRRLRDDSVHLELTLAGTGRDWSRIKSIVDEEDVDDVVRLPGLIPYRDMPDFYRSLDLFLVPRGDSLVATDTTPLKPLEALACGVPLLATGLPAMRELLGGREDVRFTQVDAHAMADDLVAFGKHPWAGSGDISERSWASEVQRYREVYACAARHGPPQPGRRRRMSFLANSSMSGLARGFRSRIGSVTAGKSQKPAYDSAASDRSSTHVVVCGFPRTGSTLLQLMVQSCLDDVRTFDGEVEALDVVAPQGQRFRMLTKYPDDVLVLDRISDAYRGHDQASAEFLITVRDPRDILTSRHAAYTEARGYYVSAERMRRQWLAVQGAMARSDASLVRYETLVRDPDSVQALFLERFGWSAHTPFSDYHVMAAQSVRDSMTDGALGGLRPIEQERLARWKQPAHAERLREVLESLPELTDMCIQLGYEPDDSWALPYLDSAGGGQRHV